MYSLNFYNSATTQPTTLQHLRHISSESEATKDHEQKVSGLNASQFPGVSGHLQSSARVHFLSGFRFVTPPPLPPSLKTIERETGSSKWREKAQNMMSLSSAPV